MVLEYRSKDTEGSNHHSRNSFEGAVLVKSMHRYYG